MDPTNAPAGDRREHERRVLRSTATILVAGAPPLAVRTLDISASGLGIVAPVNPPVRLNCTVRVTLPLRPKGSVVHESKAVVVHSIFSNVEDGFKVGLRFVDISPEFAMAVIQYMSR